jgi:transcriptional regulator with XRE-family HTH domain
MVVSIDHEYAETLGANIRAARESAELGLRELARRSEISPSYLSEIESGVSVPGIDKIQKLAKALKIGISRLLPSD